MTTESLSNYYKMNSWRDRQRNHDLLSWLNNRRGVDDDNSTTY